MNAMPALPFPHDPQRQALEWFTRLRQPGTDERQRKAFAAWCQDPENAHAFAELEARWQQLHTSPARPRPRQAKVRRSHVGKLLAALFLLLLAALAYLYWPLMQRLGSELHTAAGERRSVRLADGSTLHLDSASAVNVDLRSRTRQLQLVQGQVYLELMLDGRAMEMQVDDARIQVFGTRLMLARWADHDELRVISGKAVISQGGDQRMLSAGERVTFTGARINPVEKADDKGADAWRSGHLQVREMPLGQVLERLAGYQGKRAWVLDEQTAYRRISGDFNLDRTAESLERLATEQRLRLHSVPGLGLIAR
ncbi:FecR domain-containing protein [Pseudomonas entomophila]|uniref:FecR family protein n=1 Tax=Pseudomonas entomophila TaxID=312306 RepID=UPI0023D824DD|nr:FecR domain-containing protein [Pseudomonas entomophila]MDF0730076.1 FecR domain-containing protein [Pseudomonas entomophila]